jgi:hypothetical protein
MRLRRAGDRKHYLYVSTAKLDSPYGQVAVSTAEKKTFEWSLNIGVQKVGRKLEIADKPGEENKLQAVMQELEAAGWVGTSRAPMSTSKAFCR